MATYAWIDLGDDATQMTAPDAHHSPWHRFAPGHSNERTLRRSEPSAPEQAHALPHERTGANLTPAAC